MTDAHRVNDPDRPPLRPTRAEVDLDALTRNLGRLRDAADGAMVCAVVKADGYGHGAVRCARAAVAAGAEWLAVALVEEAEVLRAAGIDAPIAIFSEPPLHAIPRMLDARVTPSVHTAAFGRALDAAARDRGERVTVHLNVDSGMGRVGVPEDGWEAFVTEVAAWEHVRVEAIWTHMARADEPAAPTTEQQQDGFDRFLALAGRAGLTWDFVHAGNSASALVQPRARRDLVRVGIAMYGLSPSTEVTADAHDLEPVMRLVTEVAYAKRIAAGTPVSYGHTWCAPVDGWLATVPVGYADGVPRLLSNRGAFLIGGERRPIAGTVTMDQTMVWCGDHEPRIGDEVVLLGTQGSGRVTADDWAAWAETITYEVTCGISARVPRTGRRASTGRD